MVVIALDEKKENEKGSTTRQTPSFCLTISALIAPYENTFFHEYEKR